MFINFFIINFYLRTSKVKNWGYFGAFVLGKENSILNAEFVDFIKLSFENNESILSILKNIYSNQINEKYYFFLLNIFPSLFGMYHFSIGKFDDPIQIIFVIILFILNLFIIKITYKNFTLLFQTKNEFILIKSVFILFLLLTILVFLNQKYNY